MRPQNIGHLHPSFWFWWKYHRFLALAILVNNYKQFRIYKFGTISIHNENPNKVEKNRFINVNSTIKGKKWFNSELHQLKILKFQWSIFHVVTTETVSINFAYHATPWTIAKWYLDKLTWWIFLPGVNMVTSWNVDYFLLVIEKIPLKDRYYWQKAAKTVFNTESKLNALCAAEKLQIRW